MLVVAPYDNLSFGQGQNWPDADLVADGVATLKLRVENFRCSWRIETDAGNNVVPDDQNDLHVHRVVREDAMENVYNAGTWMAQRRAVGILKVSSLDQSAIQQAGRGDIGFFNDWAGTGMHKLHGWLWKPAISRGNEKKGEQEQHPQGRHWKCCDANDRRDERVHANDLEQRVITSCYGTDGQVPCEHQQWAAHNKPKRRTSNFGFFELADEPGSHCLGQWRLESDNAEYDMGEAQDEQGPRDSF